MKVFLAIWEDVPYVLLSCTTQRTNRPNQMTTYQLFMIGQLTGNRINFGFFPTKAEAMAKASTVNPELYASPYVVECAN